MLEKNYINNAAVKKKKVFNNLINTYKMELPNNGWVGYKFFKLLIVSFEFSTLSLF